MYRIYVAYVHIDRTFWTRYISRKHLWNVSSSRLQLVHSIIAWMLLSSHCALIRIVVPLDFVAGPRSKGQVESRKHERYSSTPERPCGTSVQFINPNSLNSLNSNVRAEGTIGHHKEPTPRHGPSWQSAEPDGVPRSRQTRQAQALRLCTARPEAGVAGFWRISN